MSLSLKRKNNLDLVKLICSFLVVCIHIPFPGLLGDAVWMLAQVAVPVFFMITGFFYNTVRESGREKQQIIKVLKLTLVANILHFAWGFLFSFIVASPEEYISQTLNPETMLRFFVFNESPFEIHLWYLSGLLYALVIVYFLAKKEWLIHGAYYLIPVLLLGNFILDKNAPLIFETEIDIWFGRNFLLVGLPYLLLGMFLAENINRIKDICKSWKWAVVFALALAAVIAVFGVLSLGNATVLTNAIVYIGTIFLACMVVLLAVLAPDVGENNLIAKIGKATSTEIYILHLIVKDVLAILLTGLLGSIYPWVRPVCVFVVSIVIALVLKAATGLLKRKRREKKLC